MMQMRSLLSVRARLNEPRFLTFSKLSGVHLDPICDVIGSDAFHNMNHTEAFDRCSAELNAKL
jgi:hypothetical protein